MNRHGTVLWGLMGTMVLTTLLAGSQGLGLTRMNLPYILGTMFTARRDRAKLAGFGAHILVGWMFAALYAAVFQNWRRATWWLGAAIGLGHAAFVLTAAMPLLPAMHPRMASEQQGPTPTRQLEPPGFLALNYGYRTPIAVVVSHLVYGSILGAFYRLKSAGPGEQLGLSEQRRSAPGHPPSRRAPAGRGYRTPRGGRRRPAEEPRC